MITNLTQFERVKSELKWVFYEQITSSGNFVINRKRILNQTNRNTLLKTESVLRKPPGTTEQIPKSFRDSLWRISTKGYPPFWGIYLRSNGHDLIHRKPGGGPADFLVSGAVAPLPPPRSLTALAVLVFLGTKRQSETTGRWRSTSRTHQNRLLKAKRSREGLPRWRFSARSKTKMESATRAFFGVRTNQRGAGDSPRLIKELDGRSRQQIPW